MQGAHGQFLTDNYKKAFQDAVKKRGSFCTHMAHCFSFGPLGSGKTSLLHRLIGKPLGTLATRDKSSSSSRSDDVMVPQYIIAESGKWYKMPSLEKVAVKLAEFAKFAANLSSVSFPLNILLEAYVRDETLSGDPVSDDTNPIASPQYVQMLDAIKGSKLLDNSIIISYIDHGSQPEFQEMMPVLFAGPAIFIFIFSLAEGLDSEYIVSYRSSDSEHHLYKSSLTVKEVFMQFLSSIASYHSVLSSHDVALKSRVFPLSILVVGTNKDRVSEAKVSEIDKELKEAVEETSLHKSSAIEYFSKKQLIIPVDNYNVNDDSASVRNVVERIIKNDGSPYRLEFPMPWLALDLMTLRKHASTVAYKEYTEIARKCDISEADLPKCLWFLHHKVGTIRYYGDVKELKNIVFIKPTLIFKAISELITNTFTSENVPLSQVEKFRNLGLLERDTLESIFARYEDKLQISFDAFIALLNHFNILEPSHDPELGDYFLPCALVRAPNPPCEVNLNPLLVLFNGGFVPQGVFGALLVFLLREMEWRIQCDKKGLPLLYRNQASFDDGKDCHITLRATAECLEVFVEGKQSSGLTNSLYNIRQILEKGVFNVCKNLRYNQSFYSQKFGFYCNLPKCARHIAEVDLNKEIECPVTKKKYPLNKEREYWFITNKPGFPTLSEDTVKKAKQKIYSRCQEMPNAQGIIFVIGMFDLVGTDDIVERMSAIFHDDLNFAVYREKRVTSTDLACLVKAASEYIEYPSSYRFVAFYYAGYGGVDCSGYEYLLPMQITGGNDADVLYIENNILSPFRSSIPQNCKFLFFFDCCLNNDSNEDDQLTRVTKEFDLKTPSAGLVAYATSIGHKFSNDKIYVGQWTQYLSERLTQASSLSTILGGAREDFVKHVGEDEYMFPKPRYGTDIGEVYLTEIGGKYIQAFKDAVKNQGFLPIYVVQCMPFGPPGVGKTCLLNRLCDKPAPGIRATHDAPGSGSVSTIVLDDMKVMQTHLTTVDYWNEIGNIEEQSAVFIKSVDPRSSELQSLPKDSLQQNNSRKVKVSESTYSGVNGLVPHDKTQMSNEDLIRHSNSPPASAKNDSPEPNIGNGPVQASATSPDSYTSATHNILNRLLESIKHKDMSKVEKIAKEMTTIFYTDAGGQPEFQEVLPALVAGPTIFVLVFSLLRGLNSKYHVTYHSPDSESRDYESSFTVMEVFMQCLSSITSYHKVLSRDVALYDSNSNVPPLSVLVVATHRDLVSETEVRKVDTELRKAVEHTSLYESGVIEYYSDTQLIIPVDNYDDNNDSASVNEVVKRIIRKKKGAYEIKFPVNWLAFNLSLRNVEGRSTLTLEECAKIANKCNVSQDDLEACLWFLHHRTGTIRYYGNSEKLRNIVIIQPSVMFEVITEFITSTFTVEKVDKIDQSKFKQLGLFQTKTVKEVFENYHSKLGITYNVFLDLLEHLNILGPSHDPRFGDYFLPCALVHAEEPKPFSHSEPLLLGFECGFMLTGVFSGLLAFLLLQKRWKIKHEDQLPLLYRNKVSFKYDKIGHTVTLRATAQHLEVYIERKNEECQTKVYYDVCQILQQGITKAYKTLQYDESSSTHIFQFYCSLPECEDEVLHTNKVDCEDFTVCCEILDKDYPISRERKCWFDSCKPDAEIKQKSEEISSSQALLNDGPRSLLRKGPRSPLRKGPRSPLGKSPQATGEPKALLPHSIAVSSSSNYSPFDIFKRHLSETLGVISDTERLANDLSSHDLIPYEVKDDVITTNLSRYQRASKLLNEVQRLLRHSNEPEIFMLQYCEVLMNLKNPALTKIVKDILMELGSLST